MLFFNKSNLKIYTYKCNIQVKFNNKYNKYNKYNNIFVAYGNNYIIHSNFKCTKKWDLIMKNKLKNMINIKK